MLFITWNVNSLRARLPRVLELLVAHRPDVLALQETKCSQANFPLAEIHAAGYQVVQHSGGRWAGVALLVRDGLAVENELLGLPNEPATDEARWCEATVSGTRFISVYVPNGRALDDPEYSKKLSFLTAMASRAAAIKQTGTPMLIAGDMNVAPTDADVYSPAAFAGATHVSEPERAGLAAVIEAGDLDDAYRTLHPDTQQFTWWDYRGGSFHRNLGMRIDLALISEPIRQTMTACAIDRDFRKGEKPSDHVPLLVHY